MSEETLIADYDKENREWLDAFRWIMKNEKSARAQEILELLRNEAMKNGIRSLDAYRTPYLNTIPAAEEEAYPGNIEIEKKLSAYIRWNAMMMVSKANHKNAGIGGHISTYASISDLWEVGFHHFFKRYDNGTTDQVFFQGHASPGVYARAFVEGRLSEENLANFRRDVHSDESLTSYPHPRLMPDFWHHPTVSMGLAPIQAIYQARFNAYLHARGLTEHNDQKVWAFLGDGEMDEPESRGAISIPARDKLDNLIFVIDCNLQRLDGPVRGDYKIIQELEGLFLGAGWNVIKVLWGKEWDNLFEKDKSDKLIQKLNEIPDGQLQKYAFEDGDFMKEELFGDDDDLSELVKNISGEELKRFHRGGHDLTKIYNAYKQAVEHKGGPTVILAQTIKGYGQGKSGEASNVAHQTKKMKPEGLRHFRDFFDVPVSDEDMEKEPFLRPDAESEEMKYLLERRKTLGGFIPERKDLADAIQMPDQKIFEKFYEGSGDTEVATTGVLVQIVSKLLKDPNVKDLITPIIPDESRTFGLEPLFQQVGIYAPAGAKYEPVDKDTLLYYREEKDGIVLEEGITESGCMSEFIAAGTAHYTHGLNMIPFYFFYAMFGFQRTGDLMWAAADAGARGFLIGGISGRTSLPGEGLQHLDGQSHLYAMAFPNLMAYDPAFAYEIAVIVEEGIRRMYVEKESVFYYITAGNDTYPMPAMPENNRDGILKGMYRFKISQSGHPAKAHLFGSGAIMKEVLQAAEILETHYEVSVDIWSITSYKALYDDAIDTERENRMEAQFNPRKNYIQECLDGMEGVFVAASDYVRALPESVARWFPGKLYALGADGFGRSDTRADLRRFFEVDAAHICYTTLYALASKGDIEVGKLRRAAEKLNIDANKVNPRTADF